MFKFFSIYTYIQNIYIYIIQRVTTSIPRCFKRMLPAVPGFKGVHFFPGQILDFGQARSRCSSSLVAHQEFLKGDIWPSIHFSLLNLYLSPTTTQVQQAGSIAAGCQLLDKKISPKCLASLLGIGSNRLRRAEGGAPDLRYGKREYKSKPSTFTIDSFLQICYHNIAETLPDKFLDTSFL